MNNREYSVLILGNFENVYIVQFVKHLKEYNPQTHLFFWGYTRDKNDADRSFLACYDEYYLFDINHKAGTSVFEKTNAIIQLRKHFKTFTEGKHFDYINIQYVKPEYFFLLKYFKEHASKLVLTPWGSDVYSINWFYRFFVRRVFDASDRITGGNDRFTKDFKRIFHVPDNKIAFCDLGVEPIGYIIEHKNMIDSYEAKRRLGVEDSYIITCGYKALNSHQHLKMIDSINQVKSELPPNLLLFFPLTYPHNSKYIKIIKQKVEECGLKAIYFEQFLKMPELFLLRQATDLFIHVQTTDASSGSLGEFLLCEKKIINGAWLDYPGLKKNGITPYFEVDRMENLSQVIVDAYKSEPIKIPNEVFRELEKRQWKVVIKDWDNLFAVSRE